MARRRKNKGGRPRKDGIRTKSGRLSRSQKAKDYISAKAAAENRSVALEARSRHYGEVKDGKLIPLPIEEANNPLLESEIGRLHYRWQKTRKKDVVDWRSLTEKEYDTAKRFIEDITRFYSLFGIPTPNARSVEMFSVKGYEGEESEDKLRAADRAAKVAQELQKALLSVSQGRRILDAVYNVCILDYSTQNWTTVQFGELRHGLKALGKYYGGDKTP